MTTETNTVEPDAKQGVSPLVRLRKPGAGRPHGSKDKAPRRSKKIVTPMCIKDALIAHGPKALQTLIHIMEQGAASNSDRIKCATEILNRAYGMPTKVIDANIQLDVTQEFLEALKEINAKVVHKTIEAKIINEE